MNAADIIINMVASHSWAPLLFFVLTLVNTLFSKASKFPWSPPEWLRALSVIVIGQLLAVLTARIAHLPLLYPSIDAVLTSILAISTSHAIWSHGAPPWMQWLAMLVQTLKDSGLNTPGTPPAPPTVPATSGETPS
jgi:hypothetical protein